MIQNKGFFGFIPLSDMPPKIKDLSQKSKLSYIDMHKKLRKDGRPNFSGLQIPIKSKLNADKFAHYLQGYWDWHLPMFIKFGFPLDIDRKVKIQSELVNHPSATKFSDHVDHYIEEEMAHGAIIGPFDSPPFDLHTSPFMSREKPGSNKRRIIVDLSWPKGASVNSGVLKALI